MSPYAYLPMLTHLVCHHTLAYQFTAFDFESPRMERAAASASRSLVKTITRWCSSARIGSTRAASCGGLPGITSARTAAFRCVAAIGARVVRNSLREGGELR